MSNVGMRASNILVTGSSGMIGTRLCEKLLEKGHNIVGVNLKQNSWRSDIDKLTLKIDLRNKPNVLNSLPTNVDLIIHLPANARVYNLVMDPSQARDNFEMLFNILEFARLTESEE